MTTFQIQNFKKFFIINADDYGYNAQIDRGIFQLLTKKAIKSVSVIVNGVNIVSVVSQIQKLKQNEYAFYQECSIGLHLNFTEGRPLNQKLWESRIAKDGCFLGKKEFYEIAAQFNTSEVEEVEEQVRMQVLQFIRLFKRRPSHLDGHNHVHLIPSIASAIVTVMTEMGIYRTRGLNQTLQNITIPMNHIFLSNYQNTKKMFQQASVISPVGFVGLQSFGNLNSQLLKDTLEKQDSQKIIYSSVELMCHPGYPDPQGVPWIASNDRPNQLKQLLSSQFDLLRERYKLGSYLDLKVNPTPKSRSRVLIYSKLERGCGNYTTSLRLKLIFEKMGFQVYLWNVSGKINQQIQSKDLFNFLLNFGISLIVGVNATRTSMTVFHATAQIKVPNIQIIAGTDANITFQDPVALTQLKQGLINTQCFITLSNDMAEVTRTAFQSLKIQKPIYTIVQSSCLSELLKQQKVEPKWNKPEKPYIIFPTSFRKVKCVHHLLKQLNKIIQKYDFQVFIAGPILSQSYYQECRAQLGKVKYLGVLPKPVYALYLRHAFAMINTSVSEGMSCSILQAFEMQIPVIVRRNPGNQELVTHLENGLLYSQPYEFQQMFLMLKQSKQLAQKLTDKSRELYLSKYDCLSECQKYHKLIQSEFTARVYSDTFNGKQAKIFQRQHVHPVSQPNIRLLRQIKHQVNKGQKVLDWGCGSGVFGITVLSQAKGRQFVVCITDINADIVAVAVYNYRQSDLWHSIKTLTGVVGDNIDSLQEHSPFATVLFNPPQSPFQHSSSRTDKNGGSQAIKFIEPMYSFISSQPSSAVLFQLFSLMAWPSKTKQLLKTSQLKLTWNSTQEVHSIKKEAYDEMEEGLSEYIIEHWKKGRAEIEYEEGVFRVPAVMYRIQKE